MNKLSNKLEMGFLKVTDTEELRKKALKLVVTGITSQPKRTTYDTKLNSTEKQRKDYPDSHVVKVTRGSVQVAGKRTFSSGNH